MVRSLAGVLLRRSINNIDDSTNAHLRNSLMTIWSNENNPTILKRVSHVMGQSSSGGKWVDLLPSIISHGSTLQGTSLIALIDLITIITEYCPDDILTHLQSLYMFLGNLINNSNDYKIKLSCSIAILSCITTVDDESARNSFKNLILPIINTLNLVLNNGDETDAITIINYFITISEIQPLFYKGLFDQIINLMLTITNTSDLEFPTRSIALELILCVTETAPAIARRNHNLINNIVPIIMNIIVDMDQNEREWMAQNYIYESYEENYFIGEEALERLANGIGGKTIAPVILNYVQQYMSHANFKYRRGAVSAVCRLAEGSKKFFEKEYLMISLDFILQALNDPSPVVQYQAIQAVGQFAVLYPKKMITLIHKYLLVLINFLSNTNEVCERIKGHAISAMINLTNLETSNNDPSDENAVDETEMMDALQQYLNVMLQTLSVYFGQATMEVQIVSLTLLGYVLIVIIL